MIASYRDPRYAASIRIEDIRERAPWRDSVPAELIEIYARRVARSLGGGVAIVGFGWMAITALVRGFKGNWYSTYRQGGGIGPTFVLLLSVVASIATYAIARAVAKRVFAWRVKRSIDARADALTTLARLEADGLRSVASSMARLDEEWSIGLPMAGIALLAPLAIHFTVWALASLSKTRPPDVADFDTWIRMSLFMVGLAHVVLVALCVRFARKVARADFNTLAEKIPTSGWAALGWTVAAGCIPGVIAFFVPPVLVFVTGLPVVPAMFGMMYRRTLVERRMLDDGWPRPLVANAH